MGPPAQRLTAARLETPFPRLSPALQKSTRDRWGEGGNAQQQICRFRFWPATRPNLQARPSRHCRPVRPRCTRRRAAGAGCGLSGDLTPRIAVGARRAGEIRPSGLARGRYLAGAVAPGARPWRAARGAAGRGKSYFSMGPRGRLPRGAGTPAEEPACAPTRLDFRTAAPRERRSGSPSPRTSPASARRAHTGAHAPAHSHALHTHGVSSPTPVPSSRGLPAPRRGPTQFTRPQPPARALRDQPAEVRGPWGRLVVHPEADPPAWGSPAPRGHRGHRAPGPDTRQGGRGGAATGLAPELSDWSTPQPTHPSPPPFLQHKRLQAERPSPCNLPVAQGSATSAAPGPQSRKEGRERRRAAAPRSGQRPPAEPAGYPLLSHRARSQLPPGVVPASSSSAAARLPALLPPAAEAQPVCAGPASCALL